MKAANHPVLLQAHASLFRHAWPRCRELLQHPSGLTVLQGTQAPQGKADNLSEAERTAPFRELLLERLGSQPPPPDIAELNGPQLRDRLLEVAPMDVEWVKRVNQVISTAHSRPNRAQHFSLLAVA